MTKNDITQPVQGHIAKLTPAEFTEFIQELGGLIWATPAAAAFARHKGPLNTIRDYMDISPDEPKTRRLAMELWKDLASRELDVEQLCQKWYGKTAMEMRDGLIADIAGDL